MPARAFPPDTVIENKNVVVFDGVCPLCCVSFQFIHRRDTAHVFRFATAQSQAGQKILDWCGLPTDHYKTMVYVEKGISYQRSDAVIQILRRLPQPWPLLSVARLCPRFVRDGIYNLIARNRYALFGKRNACLIPGNDLSSRFL